MYTQNYRHELKFLCAEKDLYLMENKIRHVCHLDAHTGGSGEYLISSLYFDTPDDQCYQENLAGADNRKKYRIRIYNNNSDVIKLECKYACHGMKAKETCTLTKKQFEGLIGGIPLPELLGPEEKQPAGVQMRLLERFYAEKRMELLVPKVIVEYVRAPYVFPAGNVRITFDRAIQCSTQVEGFPGNASAFRSILPAGIHILEVKYDQMLPDTIRDLLAVGQDLQRTSFSKYALCRGAFS